MRSNFPSSQITAVLLVVTLLFSVAAIPVFATSSSEQSPGMMQGHNDGAQAQSGVLVTQWCSEPDHDPLEIGGYIFTPVFADNDTEDSGELFRFEVTVSAGATFIIPTRGSSGMNFTATANRPGNIYDWKIDWGDGNMEIASGTAAEAPPGGGVPHTYAAGGTYTITITPNRGTNRWPAAFGYDMSVRSGQNSTSTMIVNGGGGSVALTGTAVISGTAKVGQTLAAWLTDTNNTGLLSYQWKADNVDIAGATASIYTLTAAQLGKTITVEVSSSVETGAIVSSPTLAVVAADPDALTGTAVISGTAKVEQTLTVRLTGSNNTGLLSYQWKADNVDIAGATGSAYTLTAAQLGKAITVEVFSSVEKGAIVSSPTLAVVAADPDALTGTAIISGKANVGQTLTVRLTGSNNTGLLSYQWKADNVDIAGATGSAYTLTAAQLDKTITVEVSSSVETGAVVSSPTLAVTAADLGAVPVTGVTLDRSRLSLHRNTSPNTATLIATVTPSDATDKTVTWASGNTAVATVDQSGNVAAVGNGTAVITVTTAEGRYTASCTVTVTTTGGKGGSSTSTYTVAFNTQGGGSISSQRVERSKTATEPEPPVRENYTFTGWYTDRDCTTLYNFNRTVTSSFTLYAGWEPVESEEIAPETITVTPYISGYPDGTFRPDTGITRAEAALLIYNPANSGGLVPDSSVGSSAGFTDVPNNAWHYNAVTYLAGTGAVSGYPNGTFMPDNTVTRAEFAVMLARFMGLSGGSASFADVPPEHWASGSIAAMKRAEYISGYPDGSFGPDDLMSRAQAVTVLNNVLNQDTAASTFSGLAMPFGDVPTGHWAYYEIMAAAVEHHVVLSW